MSELTWVGIVIVACACLACAVRFSAREEQAAAEETAARLAQAGKPGSAGDALP